MDLKMIRTTPPTKYKNDDFEVVNSALLRALPKDQFRRVITSDRCDIDQEFLGFVSVYYHLSLIIPLHFTVCDLGCAYAPQAFFYKDHAAYLGVDISDGERFAAPNTQHYEMTIGEFLQEHGPSLNLSTTFAICSYVPPWHDDNQALTRAFFEKVFVFYPTPSVKGEG